MTNLHVFFYVALILTCCSCKKLSCNYKVHDDDLDNVTVTFDLCTNHDDVCNTVDDTSYHGLQVSLENLRFDKSLKTVLIIHGFANKYPWVDEMARKWLQSEPANVIAVRWPNDYNEHFTYTKAALLTESIADSISMFVMKLNWIYGQTLKKNFHLIGHSLGAHIAGQTGRLLKKAGVEISRITGLDPALPCFEDVSASLRLRRTDAKFIDVIHTNSDPKIKTLGSYEQMGTVDIYVNGGNLQPECEKQRVFGPADFSTLTSKNYSDMVHFKNIFGCDHIYENVELRKLRETLLRYSFFFINDDEVNNITAWNNYISEASKLIAHTDLSPVIQSAFCQNSFCNHEMAPAFFMKMIDPAYPKKWANPVSNLPVKITSNLKCQNRKCYDEISDVVCIQVGTNTQDVSVAGGVYYIDTTDDDVVCENYKSTRDIILPLGSFL